MHNDWYRVITSHYAQAVSAMHCIRKMSHRSCPWNQLLCLQLSSQICETCQPSYGSGQDHLSSRCRSWFRSSDSFTESPWAGSVSAIAAMLSAQNLKAVAIQVVINFIGCVWMVNCWISAGPLDSWPGSKCIKMIRALGAVKFELHASK